ncbi:MAG: DUF998 domain-containing protein [Eubacteriales bacterium]|nr:DUF998 domain-containing protein [Eubacteriales bacterium]
MVTFRNRKLENWLGLIGVASFLVYLLAIVLAQRAYPGYRWMAQAISDLNAQNAPSHELWMRLNTISSPCGLISATVACLCVRNRLNRKLRIGIYLFAILSWVGTIGYAAFPLTESGYAGTLQDIVHVFVLTSAVLILGIASFLLLIVGGFQDRKYGSIAIIATVCLCGLVGGTIGMVTAPFGYGGLMERISVFSSVGFSFFLGLYVFAGFDWMEKGRPTAD